MPRLGQIGFLAGLGAATATIAYDIVQLLQVLGVVRFPLDEILIFGTSLCIVVPFVLEMLALHHCTRVELRFWTHAGVIFATIYAVFGIANYVVQLTTVIPAKIGGSLDAIRVLDQTPHSLLWDFDAIAYLAMGLCALLIVPALRGNGFARRAQLACIAHVAATALAGVVYFHPAYSYRLLMLGLPWAITAPCFMLLIAMELERCMPPG